MAVDMTAAAFADGLAGVALVVRSQMSAAAGVDRRGVAAVICLEDGAAGLN